MATSPHQGTPCLVPVAFETSDGPAGKGFITRISASSAAISAEPAPPVGSKVRLTFRRPNDNLQVAAVGEVMEVLREGGLWRGRPAVLIQFVDRIVIDDLVGGSGARLPTVVDGSAPIHGEPAPPSGAQGLSGAFTTTGLGRRRRVLGEGVHERPIPLVGDVPPPAEPHRLGSDPGRVGAPIRGPEVDARTRDLSAEAQFAAAALLGRAVAAAPSASPHQPVRPVDPANLAGDGQGDFDFAPPPADDEFFGQFGRVSGHSIEAPSGPEVTPDDPFGFGGIGFDGGSPDIPGILDDDAPGPVAPPPPRRPNVAPDLVPTNPASAMPARPAPSGQGAPPRAPIRGEPVGPPPVHSTMSIGASVSLAPWEQDDAPVSLLPKFVRIASSLPVSFWARGRNYAALAQNFSREGIFLAAAGQPPVRGAIIRVEFPLEGDGESVPVRFNAEVRWHRSDRPVAGQPDGFGVQILTFETPKDRARYEELLRVLLTQAPPEPKEYEFSWTAAAPRAGR